MSKAKWMTGSLMALALLTGGVASAQGFQPQQNSPQDQDDLPEESDQPAPPRADDDFSDVIAADQDRTAADAPADRYGRQDEPADDEAITNCALAARDEAERDGGYAEVRQVQQPRETRGGYDVEGDVEVRSGWRAQDGTSRHFTCTVRNGRIADVYFRTDRATR
jgi:hypothetical protein